jgi:signal transduction histidine kinase/energy-coupling factor transporter ATP-binding protein EcfA2
MDKNKALQKLLNGTASEEEVDLLKQGLVSGEISIGGNVNQSVIIIGNGNTVGITPEILDKLNARSFLGTLDRDLTGDEINLGLKRLESELLFRAPILLDQFHDQARRLQPTVKTNLKSLSEQARRERIESLAVINGICNESLDISFNALCLGEEPPEYDSRSPFRGLESFRPEDSEFFFGREALTKKLVAKIQAYPFLAVLGASGSGKSSLVKAGLIPTLGSAYAIFRPGTDPFLILEAIGLVSEEIELIVVDQFEELFTLTSNEAARKEFITKLMNVKLKIIITLRSDFLGEVSAYRDLSEVIQSHLEIIPPMSMDELSRAMEGQAGAVGLRFEADLSQQILDDVEGEPGAMPLLQHALWELWNRRHGRWLRASEYRAFGGVKQAITSTAEKIYGECSKAEQEQIRDIFLRLTRLDDSDEGRDTRRRVAMSDLIPSERDTASITLLLDKLANARLIVKTVNDDKTEVEAAHEALIRHWERLRLWLNEDHDNLRLREEIIDAAKQWETGKRDETLLIHRAGRLEYAVSLSKDLHYGLTHVEQAYLNECVIYQKREQKDKEEAELLKRKVEGLKKVNENLHSSEQSLRSATEGLARSSRQLSSQMTIEKLPQQILELLQQVLSYDRGVLFFENVIGVPNIHAHHGLPADANISEFRLQIDGVDFYETVARKGETFLISDLSVIKKWEQPDWLPRDHSWLGVPLCSKDKVIGLLALSRSESAFNGNDALMANTFAAQAIGALEKARFYTEVGAMNQMMERMTSLRVEELNTAYVSLAQHDKNKSAFINVAAHELGMPLTVIRGYLNMIKDTPAIQSDPMLMQAMDSVLQGANRLQDIVNRLLDVARLDNQVINPHLENVSLGPILRLIQKEYESDLAIYRINLELDSSINLVPPLLADSELLCKALDNIIVNAIQFTPDGGFISVFAEVVEDLRLGKCAEIRVKDTGIGIDPEYHKIIFEKLIQLGRVELHSFSRTSRLGLGLAIATGIVKAQNGAIWVESPGYDEKKLPGSTFFIRIPLVLTALKSA